MRIIIPARKGSKGLPHKNRKLFDYTFDSIPIEYRRNVTVSTDDHVIMNKCEEKNIRLIARPEEYSNDTASMKSVVKHAIDCLNIEGDELILVLYLTYPERTWEDIMKAIHFYADKQPNSLLCKKKPKTNPFLCLKEEDNNKGSQLFYHNLYRRQDYPNCFEISHFVCLFTTKEIDKLNDNLYNNETMFIPIEDPVDVDTESDLKKFLGTS